MELHGAYIQTGQKLERLSAVGRQPAMFIVATENKYVLTIRVMEDTSDEALIFL